MFDVDDYYSPGSASAKNIDPKDAVLPPVPRVSPQELDDAEYDPQKMAPWPGLTGNSEIAVLQAVAQGGLLLQRLPQSANGHAAVIGCIEEITPEEIGNTYGIKINVMQGPGTQVTVACQSFVDRMFVAENHDPDRPLIEARLADPASAESMDPSPHLFLEQGRHLVLEPSNVEGIRILFFPSPHRAR